MKIGFKYKSKKISLDVKKCNLFQMGRGLTFRRRKNARALLFEGLKRENMTLTALFVFFPFVAIWLDKKNKVLDVKVVRPFTFLIDSKSEYAKIVEIPINDRYRREVSFLVGKRKI